MAEDNKKRRKVLVVEDEPVIGLICRRMLTAEGFDVDIAVNGLVAKQMVDDKSYDLCLSDIKVPGMDGIQLYKYLEQEHPELARRFIFITGDVMSSYIAQFLDVTTRPYLCKPFTPDELKKVIRDTLAANDSP
jgi:CheY-like chemotaxis protein